MNRQLLLVGGFGFSALGSTGAPPPAKPLLMQSPTLSQTQICFAYGGNIWVVARAGGEARRLVAGSGLLSGPVFSPDGTLVAYTGDYEGDQDVYLVAARGARAGRAPQRAA